MTWQGALDARQRLDSAGPLRSSYRPLKTMPRLKYWIAERLDDSSVYSIIAKTKREVVKAVSEEGEHCKFGRIHQRELYYEDAFDLFDICTGEDGGRVMGYRAKKK